MNALIRKGVEIHQDWKEELQIAVKNGECVLILILCSDLFNLLFHSHR